MKIIFSIFLAVSLLNSGYSQFSVFGVIKDNTTNKPIEGVHIKGFNTNAISDSSGFFSLKIDHDSTLLIFTHISYTETQLMVDSNLDLGNLEIEMRPSILFLEEVSITDMSPEQSLIKKVIDNIDLNYYKNCYSQKAFIRESLFDKDIPLKLTEAISLDKISFQDSLKFIKKSHVQGIRSYINQSYKKYPKYRIAGALSVIKSYNPLLNKKGPFSAKEFRRDYSFDILDTLKIEKRKHVLVSFKNIKNSKEWQGKIIINLIDFSVLDFSATKSINKPIKLSSYNTEKIEIEVKYEKESDFYYTKSVAVKQFFSPIKNDTLSSVAEYKIVEVHQDCDSTDSQSERIYDNDILSEISSKNNSDHLWESIAENDDYGYLFGSLTGKNKNFLKKPKFYYGFKPSIWFGKNQEARLEYTNPSLTFTDTLNIDRLINIGMSLQLGLDFERLRVELDLIDPFYDFVRISGRYINVVYLSKPLLQQKITVGIGTKFGVLKHRDRINTFPHQEKIEIGEKTFDSGSIDVFFEQRSFQLNPSFYVFYQINNRTKLQLESTFLFNLTSSTGLFLRENDNFLKAKRTFTTSSLTINQGKPFGELINKALLISIGFTTNF